MWMVLYTENNTAPFLERRICRRSWRGRRRMPTQPTCRQIERQERQISYQHSGAHQCPVQSRIRTCSGSPGRRYLFCDWGHRPAHSPHCYFHMDCWLGEAHELRRIEKKKVSQDPHNHWGTSIGYSFRAFIPTCHCTCLQAGLPNPALYQLWILFLRQFCQCAGLQYIKCYSSNLEAIQITYSYYIIFSIT